MRRDDPYELANDHVPVGSTGDVGSWDRPYFDDDASRDAYMAELAERAARRIPVGFAPPTRPYPDSALS